MLNVYKINFTYAGPGGNLRTGSLILDATSSEAVYKMVSEALELNPKYKYPRITKIELYSTQNELPFEPTKPRK